MTAPDPRLDEIQARLDAATPGPWETHQDMVRIGFEELEPLSVAKRVRKPGVTEMHYVVPWVNEVCDQEFIANAPDDVAYLLAELRKARERARRVAAVATRYRDERNEAREALTRVEELHSPVKIYDECDCPDGTHPDEYDYIDCEDYVGCENSLSGIGCQECCVDSWDSLTQDCGENHSHSKDPAFRCDTIKALRAAVAAANGDA